MSMGKYSSSFRDIQAVSDLSKEYTLTLEISDRNNIYADNLNKSSTKRNSFINESPSRTKVNTKILFSK